MKKIESSVNPRIKNLKKVISGKNKNYWIIEGKRLFREAIESGVAITEVFVTKAAWNQELAREFKNAEIVMIPDSLMSSISTLETPPGILAVARRESLAEPILRESFAAFLWSVRDPGNLGTIVRSAEATGCRFIACSPDCADAYSPKVVRASMGSVFRIPIFTVTKPKDYLASAREKRIFFCGLIPRDGINLFESNIREPAMIIIGGEGSGLPDDLPLDLRISIPMSERVESLNTGVAASIAFYHFMTVMAKNLS